MKVEEVNTNLKTKNRFNTLIQRGVGNMAKFIATLKRIFKKINKKILLIGCLAIITLIILIVVISNMGPKNELLKLIYDIESPIAIKKGGKYGYVDFEGNTLIEPAFESAGQFYGEYTLVSTIENDEEVFQIIDKKGSVILTSSSANKPRYYSEYGVWLVDNKIYSKDVKEIFKDDYHMTHVGNGYFSYQDNKKAASGIIDYSGKKVFSWDEDYISIDISEIGYTDAERYAAISNYEEREEILDLTKGKTIFTLDDPKNQYLEVEDENVFRIIDRENSYKTIKWMYISDSQVSFETTEEIYEITIDSFEKGILKIDYGSNYEESGKQERYAYYNVKEKKYMDSKYGKEESTTKNDWMEEQYGFKTYTCSGLYGIMIKDKILLDCTHTDIHFLEDTLYDYMKQYHKESIAIIQKDTNILVYNMKKKEELLKYDIASLEETDESTFLLLTTFEQDGFTKKNYVVYNLVTKKSKEFAPSSDISVHSNYITVGDGSKNIYYNANLNEIFTGEI